MCYGSWVAPVFRIGSSYKEGYKIPNLIEQLLLGIIRKIQVQRINVKGQNKSKDNNIKSYHLLSIYCVLSVYQISYILMKTYRLVSILVLLVKKKNWNSEVK